MIKASIDLQDLRRRLYVKAKAEPSWRFWGLYVHVCKMETLREAYALAITLLPTAPASAIHQAAESIAAYADKYRDRTRVRTMPTGRTRIIKVVDE